MMQATEQMDDQQVVSRKSQVVAQMSVGAWIVTYILMMIPLVNIIMLFIWAFDATSLRRNFARAYLIIMGIMIGISIVITIIAVVLGMSSGIFSSTI